MPDETYTCFADCCGRVHGVTGPYQLCVLHRHELNAGVEVVLTTGYALYRDRDGEMQIRKPEPVKDGNGMEDAA